MCNGGQCTKNSKILCAISGGLLLVGVILFVVAYVQGNSAATIEFAVKDSNSFSVTVPMNNNCGFSLYTRTTESCTSVVADTYIYPPNKPNDDNSEINILSDCGSFDDWASKQDPPLQKIGHFFPRTDSGVIRSGTYTVKNNPVAGVATGPGLWALDLCQQVGEVVGGLFAAMGIFVGSMLALVAAAIVSCVSCCCMGPKEQQIQGQGTVVGQPVEAVA